MSCFLLTFLIQHDESLCNGAFFLDAVTHNTGTSEPAMRVEWNTFERTIAGVQLSGSVRVIDPTGHAAEAMARGVCEEARPRSDLNNRIK